MLERHGDDPVMVDAALSGVRGSEPALLGALLKAQTETPQLSAAITMIAATIVRAGQDGPLQDVFALVADRPRDPGGSVRPCCAARRRRCLERRCPAVAVEVVEG